MAGIKGAVGVRSGDVSRASSPAGAVFPRRENTVTKTACPWIPKTGTYSLLGPEISIQDAPYPQEVLEAAVQGNSDLSLLNAPGLVPASGGSALCGPAPHFLIRPPPLHPT